MLSELVLVATMFLSAAQAPEPRANVPFHVVANATVRVSSLSRAELSAIFMRRRRSWSDGTEIHPVEPPSRSAVRERFSREVHGKSVAFVTRYWHRVIFAGRGVPPEELASDAAIVDYVRTHRGAIGYVEARPGDGVKTIAVTP